MRRTVAAGIGAVVFWAAHAVETARWREWFAGTYDPWFLNSGRAMIFTLGCVCIASALVTWFDSVPGRARGVPIGVGATAAMAATLFVKASGPGTIFPIALVAAAVMLLFSSLAGAWAVSAIRPSTSPPR